MSEDIARAARLEAEREEQARAGAGLRRAMIAAGVLVPASRAIDPFERRIASLAALPIDDAGRRVARRDLEALHREDRS